MCSLPGRVLRHGPDARPVLVFDATRENSKDLTGQTRHMIFHVQVRGTAGASPPACRTVMS
jgi:hypothetical protein